MLSLNSCGKKCQYEVTYLTVLGHERTKVWTLKEGSDVFISTNRGSYSMKAGSRNGFCELLENGVVEVLYVKKVE